MAIKIHYQYTKYEHSKAATGWSSLRNALLPTCFLWIGLLGVGISELLACFIKGKETYEFYGISVVPAIIIYGAFHSFCKYKERDCALIDEVQYNIGRKLTDEEKKKIRERYKMHKKEQQQKERENMKRLKGKSL